MGRHLRPGLPGAAAALERCGGRRRGRGGDSAAREGQHAVKFEPFISHLLLAVIIGITSHLVNRLDAVQEQVAQIRVDVATLKSHEPAIASSQPLPH